MDHNFHLLEKDQIQLLEDISKFETDFGDTQKSSSGEKNLFSFEETRNKVDVIILKSDDAKIFEKELLSEEKEIRKAIADEKRRREQERNGSIKRGEEDRGINWPEDLYCYEGKVTVEDLFSFPIYNHYEEYHHDDSVEETNDLRRKINDVIQYYTNFENEKNKIEQDIKIYDNQLRDKNLADEYRRRRRDLFNEKRARERDFQERRDGSVYGSIDNYQLRQLDLRLRQIICYRFRLDNSTQAWWSGSLLGCYLSNRDSYGRRHLYLFIDNILAHAHSNGFSSNSVIASTFTHEMFHAYYDDIESKDFIRKYLHGIREVEEAMVEYSMLRFLSVYDSGYKDDAYDDVVNKLNSRHPYLQCYGLGACLFDEWNANRFPTFKNGFFAIPFYEMYQKIQPAPRHNNQEVDQYHNSINRVFYYQNDKIACIQFLYQILFYYNSIIEDKSQHFSFNDESIIFSKQLVCKVLNYYVDDHLNDFGTEPDLAEMELAFDNRNPYKFKARGIFKDSNNINARNENSYDMKQGIKLSDTDIYPLNSWSSEGGGNTQLFIEQVNKLFQTGQIKRNIIILR